MTLLFRLLGTLAILVLTSNHIYSQEISSNIEENLQFIKNRGYSFDACLRIAEDYLVSKTEQRKAIPYLEYAIESDKTSNVDLLNMLAEAYY